MNLSRRSDAYATGLRTQVTVTPTRSIHAKSHPFRWVTWSIVLLFALFANTAFSTTPDCLVTGTGTTTPACTGSANGTATITLSGDGSGAPGTYTVDGGSAQSFSSNPFTISGLTVGSHTIVATVTAGGCVSSPIIITVGTNQLPTITASASPAIICNGSSTTLLATGASTYTWMPGSLSGASVSVSPTATTTYTVTGTSADGCVGGNIWASISAGGSHNVAIKTDGTLWAWGDNLYGQLGDGTNTLKKVPVQIGTATNWVKVSGGNNHSLAIKSDGTLWGWGFNGNGMLGDGTIIDKNTPVQIGVATTWASISAAGSHSIGMRTNGTLWAWGYNNYGQLGDGTFTQRTSPVQIGVATNWASISAASDHSMALKTDGTLWSWGRNTFGQLGDGTVNSRNTPGQVGVATDWAKFNACYYHSMAVKTNGTLWSWGYNLFGQIGDGTTTQRTSPIQIGIATDWTDVEGGLYQSFASKTNGSLWSWGYNVYGQLGDGSQTNRLSPVQLVGAATNWGIFSTGIYHSVGLRTTGSLYAWGYNNVGQLGDNTMFLRTSPTQIGSTVVSVTVTVNALPTVSFSGLAASYCQAAPVVTLTGLPASGTFSGPGISGNTFTAAVAGVGTHSITYSYTDVNGCTKTSLQSVSVVSSNPLDYINLQFPGTASFCQGGSLTVYGQVYEGGLTEAGGAGAGVTAELGYSTTNSNPATWINWQPAIFNVQSGNNDEYASTLTLPAGTYYYAFRYTYTLNTCGYQYGGYSAGGGNAWDGVTYVSGVLTVNAPPTVTVSPSSPTVCSGSSVILTASGASTYTWNPGALSGSSITVSPTTNTTYTVSGTSTAGCTGGNSWAYYSAGSYHNLGFKTNGTMWASGQNTAGQIGDGTLTDKPNPIQITGNWASVSTGGFHTIAIKTDGTLWAWGSNGNGQLGDGTIIDKTSPVQIGAATNWAAVSAGSSHSLAMKTDGTLWGWGRNDYGQVGDGTFTQKTSPVQSGAATNWVSFSAGGSHSIGIKNNGTLWTWGRNTFGQLGDGTTAAKNVPTQMGTGTNWKTASGGFFHTLGIKTDGTLWTWGYNLFGQIGDGTTTDKLSPLQIGSATNWSAVKGGLYHSLALRTNGTLWSWGANNYGQLGDGSTVQRTSPVQIGAITTWMSITGGAYHSAGIRSNGSLWAWGRNMEGQLGDGNTLVLAQINPIQIGSTTVSVTVTVNPLPVVSFTGLAANYCTNSSAATLTGTPAGGTFSGPGMSGNVFDPAIAGTGGPYAITYSYTDINGCTNSETQNTTVTGFTGGSVSFSGLAATYCTSDAPATLTGNQAGGTFSGAGVIDNGNGTASFDPAVAGSGTHNITYTYSNGTCSSTFTGTTSVLPNYNITATAGANGSVTPAGVTAVCSGGGQVYTITADGGYSIGDVLVDGVSQGSITTYTFTNVIAAHTISASFLVDCVVPSLSSTITNITCNGGSNGAIDLVLSGGSAPFTYSWTGPGGFTSSAEDLTGLIAGPYTVTVTATGGCSTTDTYMVSEPDELLLVCSGTNVNCNGANNGTTLVNVTGGTGVYTYSWTDGTSTGGSVSINAAKDNNIYANSPTNSNALGGNLAIGKSNSGATHRALMAFDIAGNLPAGAIITSATLNLSVSASAPGAGIQPIYLHRLTSDWGEGTSFTTQSGIGTAATTNDATWSHRFYPSTTWSNAGGDFDALASATTNVNTSGFYAWSSAGMVANIQDWLNTPANNYGWMIKGIETASSQSKRMDSRENLSPANVPVLDINYSIPNIVGTGDALSNLSPGSYTVTVTDANGCTATCTYTVTQPDLITVTAIAGTINCNGGTTSVTVTATGGSGNYANGTGVFNNVGAGTYTYIVTDDNGCAGSTTITINEPSPIIVSFSGLAASYCTTDAAVTLTGTPSGGTFSGIGIFGNNFDPATAGVGTHTILYSYTDINGCSNSASQQVTVTTCGNSITLSMKLYLQGYYTGAGSMQPVLNNQGVPLSVTTEADSITVELHDQSTYALVDTKQALLLTNGTVSVTFTQPAGLYYIAIKHRSSLQTWSAAAMACSASTPLYDFSTAANKAFGDNQVEVEPTVWAFFSGDLNQDDFIDSNDFPDLDNDIFNGVAFVYVATDLNGDGFVDSNDFPVLDGNIFNGASSIVP